jgi:hypothetical protein
MCNSTAPAPGDVHEAIGPHHPVASIGYVRSFVIPPASITGTGDLAPVLPAGPTVTAR